MINKQAFLQGYIDTVKKANITEKQKEYLVKQAVGPVLGLLWKVPTVASAVWKYGKYPFQALGKSGFGKWLGSKVWEPTKKGFNWWFKNPVYDPATKAAIPGRYNTSFLGNLTGWGGVGYLGAATANTFKDEYKELNKALRESPTGSMLGGAAIGALAGSALGNSPTSALIGAGIGTLGGYAGHRLLNSGYQDENQ